MKRITTLFLAFCLTFTLAKAQSDDWKFSGEIYIRSELDGRDFQNVTYPLTFTSMKTRFGVEKKLFENASAYIQMQDSRVWGETKNTISNLKNLDMHQGYLKFGNLFDTPLSVQAGRFEVHYNNGRFLASNQFHYVSRSWDGVRASYSTKPLQIDLFSLTHNNSVPYIGSAVPDTTQYPFSSKPESGYNVHGLRSNIVFDKDHNLDIIAYFEQNRLKTAKGNPTAERFLLSAYYKLAISDFFTVIEGAYQGGTAGDQKVTGSTKAMEVSAYTAAISLNYKIQDFTIGLNADMVSGTTIEDQKKGEINNTYDGTFQGKHTFYGYMDYFSSMSKSTSNLGLNDMFLSLKFAPKESSIEAALNAHYFMTNQPYTLQDGTENSNLGQEIDLILDYKLPIKGSVLQLGGCMFLPSDVMKDIYDVTKNDGVGEYDRTDPAFWAYLALKVAF